MPILIMLGVLLVYPSFLLAGFAGLASFAYILFGGNSDDQDRIDGILHKLAFRSLCIKLAVFNGPTDQRALEVHTEIMHDFADNAYRRRDLRIAASATPEFWEPLARMIYQAGRKDAFFLTSRYRSILVQLTSQPENRRQASPAGHFLREEVQERMIQLAKIWKLGPKTTRELFEQQKVVIGPTLAGWK